MHTAEQATKRQIDGREKEGKKDTARKKILPPGEEAKSKRIFLVKRSPSPSFVVLVFQKINCLQEKRKGERGRKGRALAIIRGRHRGDDISERLKDEEGGERKRGPWGALGDNTFLSDNPGRYSEQNGRVQTHTRKSFLVITHNNSRVEGK